MKERPILFSGEMVRAILEGRKTQTRRVIKPQPSAGVRNSVFVKSGLEDGHGREMRCPYGVPGDRLWVRETWRELGSGQRADGGIPKWPCDVLYRADTDWDGPWRPSIFMPRWASRLSLEITGIRVERVQDISEEDAYAEGITEEQAIDAWYDGPQPEFVFMELWDSINAKRGFGWDVNPWVWVVEFSPSWEVE